MDSYLQFITVLIIFIAVLGLTLYATRWLANYQKGTSSCRNIEIVDTCKISANKYIQIVRMGDRYVAIGVSGDQITNLGDVSPESLVMNDEQQESLNFKDIFDKIKGEKKSSNDK